MELEGKDTRSCLHRYHISHISRSKKKGADRSNGRRASRLVKFAGVSTQFTSCAGHGASVKCISRTKAADEAERLLKVSWSRPPGHGRDQNGKQIFQAANSKITTADGTLESTNTESREFSSILLPD